MYWGWYVGPAVRSLSSISLFVACSVIGGLAHAQSQPSSMIPMGGIYSCRDARGRTITADRPIPDCMDRAQRELSSSGSARRTVSPTYSTLEQDERDERARRAKTLDSAQTDERRRERALLARYSSSEVHERERTAALAQIDSVAQAARLYLVSLSAERRRIDSELEFYKKDPAKAPISLQLRLEENVRSVDAQNRFIDQQAQEARHVNGRFNDERARLVRLWRGAQSQDQDRSSTK